MIIPRFISYVSIFIWLLPPIRQYKGNYFYFFLVLALLDPIVYVVRFILPLDPMRIYTLCTIFLVFALIKIRHNKFNWFYIAVLTIINTYLSFSLSFDLLKLYLILQLIVVFFIILRKTLLDTFTNGQINLFYFVLVLYLLSVLTKMLITFTQFSSGIFYFYFTTAFEILIAVFFIFYNDVNIPKIKLNG